MVAMATTAETVVGVSAAMTVGVGELWPQDVALTSSDLEQDEELTYLQPPTWNESSIPYLGDLTPKPTWEIVVKVSRLCQHH